MTEKAASTGTEAAERVADVLLTLSRVEHALGVSAIARELGISKAVVHRILQSLATRGLVQFEPADRAYRLGPNAAAMGARALRQMDLRAIARDELIALRDETLETTTLSQLIVDRRAYVEQFESPQEIKMTIELGRLYPLYAGASSRAILAFLPENDVVRVVGEGLRSLTEETVTDTGALLDLLAETRERGYATSNGERQSGAGSVAAPIFRSDGQVVGSISACGPLSRFTPDRIQTYVPLVVKAAANISAGLN